MTLDLMKLSSPLLFSSSSYCMRGLEKLSSSDKKHSLKKSTRVRRRNALWSVLNEQDRQWYETVSDLNNKKGKQTSILYDDVKIKDVYKNYNRVSEDIAYSMGRIDASSVIGTSIDSGIDNGIDNGIDSGISMDDYNTTKATIYRGRCWCAITSNRCDLKYRCCHYERR